MSCCGQKEVMANEKSKEGVNKQGNTRETDLIRQLDQLKNQNNNLTKENEKLKAQVKVHQQYSEFIGKMGNMQDILNLAQINQRLKTQNDHYEKKEKIFKEELQKNCFHNSKTIKSIINEIEATKDIREIYTLKQNSRIEFNSIKQFFGKQAEVKNNSSIHENSEIISMYLCQAYNLVISSKKVERQIIICVIFYIDFLIEIIEKGYKQTNEDQKFKEISNSLKKMEHVLYSKIEEIIRICKEKFRQERSMILEESRVSQLIVSEEIMLRDKIESLEERIRELLHEKESIETQNELYSKKTVPELKDQLQKRQREIEALRRQSSDIPELNLKQVRQKDNLIEQLKRQINQMTQKGKLYQTQESEKINSKQELGAKIDKQNQELAGKVKILQAKIADKESQIDRISNEKESLSILLSEALNNTKGKQRQTLENITGLTSQIQNLKSELESSSQIKEQLSKKISEKEQKITDLQLRLKAIQQNQSLSFSEIMTSNSQKLILAAKENEQLKTEVHSLKQLNNSLRKLQVQVTQLKSLLEDKEKQAKQEKQRHKTQSDQLNKKIGQLKVDIQGKDIEIQKYRQNYDNQHSEKIKLQKLINASAIVTEQFAKEKQKYEHEITELQTCFDQAKQKLDQQLITSKQLQSEKELIQRQNQVIKQSSQTTLRQLQILSACFKQEKEVHNQLQSNFKALQQQSQLLQNKIEELQLKQSKSNEAIETLREEINTLSGYASNLEAELLTSKEELEKSLTEVKESRILKTRNHDLESELDEAKQLLMSKSEELQMLQESQSRVRTISFVEHMTLFIGDLLEDKKHEKKFLTSSIQTHMNRSIEKTKKMYEFKRDMKTNFHSIIDNHSNLVIIVETSKALFAGYYSGQLLTKGTMQEQALIISLNNRKYYTLNNLKNNPKKDSNDKRIIRGMSYDSYYIIFGNAQIRIKTGENKVFSNFGIMNSYFDNKKDKVDSLLGQGPKNEIELINYEIHQVFFAEQYFERVNE